MQRSAAAPVARGIADGRAERGPRSGADVGREVLAGEGGAGGGFESRPSAPSPSPAAPAAKSTSPAPPTAPPSPSTAPPPVDPPTPASLRSPASAPTSPSSYLDTASDAFIAGARRSPPVHHPGQRLARAAACRLPFRRLHLLPRDRLRLKHTLSAGGATFPEEAWGVLYLGAEAFALDAYLAVVNANFEFADSALRDKIDDTKSAVQWQAQARPPGPASPAASPSSVPPTKPTTHPPPPSPAGATSPTAGRCCSSPTPTSRTAEDWCDGLESPGSA